MKLIVLLKKLKPPDKWNPLVIFSLAIFVGIVLAILKISNAVSYLSDNPQTCMNCHVMSPQYASWQHSSHARVATCNDCHVPQDNFIRKYAFKAMDGLRHSTIFTLRLEPQVIKIKQAGINAVQENCKRCHYSLVNQTELAKVTGKNSSHENNLLCWQCHRETPHGRVNSLSSVPFARVPQLTPVMPEWLDKFTKIKKTNN